MLAITWDDLASAGAFVLGIVVGGFGVIVITRHMLNYLREERASSRRRGE